MGMGVDDVLRDAVRLLDHVQGLMHSTTWTLKHRSGVLGVTDPEMAVQSIQHLIEELADAIDLVHQARALVNHAEGRPAPVSSETPGLFPEATPRR